MTSPVFFDGSGRRRRLMGRLTALVILAMLFAAIGFAVTLADVPAESALTFGNEREQPLPFRVHLARLSHHIGGVLAPLGLRLRLPAQTRLPQRIGFYVPWDNESFASLRRHIGDLDEVDASLGSINAQGNLTVRPDAPLARLAASQIITPATTLMVQNFVNGQWDAQGPGRLFTNPLATNDFIDRLSMLIRQQHWQGVMLDFENLPDTALPAYRHFLDLLHRRLSVEGIRLSLTVPAGEQAWRPGNFATHVDRVVLMDYDQHWQGGEPGPIAARDWFAAQLAEAIADVPPAKLVVAIGSYAYDWHDDHADALTLPEAWLAAHDSGTRPLYDPASGNSGFAYDDDGHRHSVWMLDAAASIDQLSMMRHAVGGIALWRLGSEDPGIWDAWRASRVGGRADISAIPSSVGTDVVGNGEILRLADQPQPGRRHIDYADGGLVANERYLHLPTPFEVRRSGAATREVALTFDDGPDPDWTPPILDVLQRYRVPATFFVIGENAMEQPLLLRRMVADGHELGNHSYTHPNLAEVEPFGVRLELNATQRLIEAYTGRSTRLFRAPYFGDAEPTTADELYPAQIAQGLGYTIVGLHADPGDWRTPGVRAIVDRTVEAVESGNSERSANIVLLHDGGGDRSQTVAALPAIIQRLRTDGYRFVTASQLGNISRDAAMPPVTGFDLLQVRGDVAVFVLLAILAYALKWLFFFAIALGIARAIFLTSLALLDRQRQVRGDYGASAQIAADEKVTVIIPAFNEERVILSSIARILVSDYANLQLIVADDGSKDGTSRLVNDHYGDDPRVRLITLANGGKASALNHALALAEGAIIIALDADTQFPPDTISKLVRWFSDPAVGAVAGNARVGNKVNLITRWQAIEYVTAQNVERRALDALSAITVVPGAVGAWRRAAIAQAGGYPEDTLAEDQDLTIAIQRQGWKVAYDISADAWTEAPETFRALGKQRYRWSFGTLQCLWKHRAVIADGRPRGLAWIGMPQAWLFQIVFAAVSPLIDLALLVSLVGVGMRVQQHGWAQTQSDVGRMAVYWLIFVLVDCLAGWIAYRLDPRREPFPALLLIAQRLVYRQLMYGVVIRSIDSALRGRGVGWGKLDRTGRVGQAASI